MKCYICTSFRFSMDGINSRSLEKGDVIEIPDHMVKGLVFEGYVKEYIEPKEDKAIGAAVENKALFGSEENKSDEDAPRRGPGRPRKVEAAS